MGDRGLYLGGGGGLIIGCIFLSTGRWVYNWEAYKRNFTVLGFTVVCCCDLGGSISVLAVANILFPNDNTRSYVLFFLQSSTTNYEQCRPQSPDQQ